MLMVKSDSVLVSIKVLAEVLVNCICVNTRIDRYVDLLEVVMSLTFVQSQQFLKEQHRCKPCNICIYQVLSTVKKAKLFGPFHLYMCLFDLGP